MSHPGFEPAIPASPRPHTHALDDAATGIGQKNQYTNKHKGIMNDSNYDVLYTVTFLPVLN
jgi:hypothetical protein